MEHEYTSVETAASEYPVEFDVGATQIEFLGGWGVMLTATETFVDESVWAPMTIANARDLVAALNAAIAKAEAMSAKLPRA